MTSILNKKLTGLTSQLKEKLLQQALERRLAAVDNQPVFSPAVTEKNTNRFEKFCSFSQHPGYQQVRIINDGAARLGINSPFFKLHEQIAGATTSIKGSEYINFASYNYLGMSGDPVVSEAARQAIDLYGTSVSASRLVSGERPLHRELEQALARLYDVDDAVIFVSGHATNVTVIGHLFGPNDLIVHDELIHNSVLQGAQLAGARRLSFPHNDAAALDALLTRERHAFERVLIVLEGVYSMDGDYPDLPFFVELKQRHHALLMVDEAHSFGVMGKTGHGIREHFDLKGDAVDIWMGTLSKALAGCGGYIAGSTALVEHLKFLAPGFLYSVGMSPPLAAASLAALQQMQRFPERVEALQSRGRFFLHQARAAGINTGLSAGLAIIPVITGSSIKAVRISEALFIKGINVQPIIYPAVPEKTARLRFFINCNHTEEQIRSTITALQESELSL